MDKKKNIFTSEVHLSKDHPDYGKPLEGQQRPFRNFNLLARIFLVKAVFIILLLVTVKRTPTFFIEKLKFINILRIFKKFILQRKRKSSL